MTDEDSFQIAVCAYLDIALPKEAVYFAVPNGGSRNMLEAVKLKRMGLKPGIPDLFVYYKGALTGIELKYGKGKPTALQLAMHKRLYHAGCGVYVCRTLDEVIAALTDECIPLKGRVGV